MVGLIARVVPLAGYSHYEKRVERHAEYFPTLPAAVLLMGLDFIGGVF